MIFVICGRGLLGDVILWGESVVGDGTGGFVFMDGLRLRNVLKFVVVSVVGMFLFMAPIPTEDAFNIPLGIVISWLEGSVFQVSADLNLNVVLLLAVVTISALGSIFVSIFRPEIKCKLLKDVFSTTLLYFVSRLIAFVFVWMIFLGVGPEFVVSPWTGGVMQDISAHLITVFLVLGFAIPILTDFGIMEFTGVLIRKIVRKLFTLPGRSSVDLMASWFGSSLASIILTRGQHEKGYYTGREAVVICTNFAFVSLPFSFVIASQLGIQSQFVLWYVIICITCILLALITPRIWPLRQISDEYLDGVKPQSDEDVPVGVSNFKWALHLATERAQNASFKEVLRNGIEMYVNIFFDLIPIILAWGTISIAIFEFTEIFQFISIPMGWYLQLFNVAEAMEFAPATLIGFLDMFLPAVLLGETAILNTRLILGALSIVQIIYMTETGISIIKSKMPINIWKLFVIFMIRTLIAIPILVLLVNVLF